jgi:uncharacterized protein
METIHQKLSSLKHYIAEVVDNEGVIIAFSGGVDSSTLAAISHMVLGKKAVAAIAQSPIHITEELQNAKKIAAEIGIALYCVQTDELSNPNFSANSENRCYYCKKDLLVCLKNLANQLGFKIIFEGTNYSDLSSHRPGFEAMQEISGVFNPWIANKFTKDEIRQLAKHLGLSVYDKPSLACLASRIAFNQKITQEKLLRIDNAEQVVKAVSGVKQVRVRDHDGLARIEVPKTEFLIFNKITVWDQISNSLLKLGFKYVTLDLQGYRSGSMLKTLEE